MLCHTVREGISFNWFYLGGSHTSGYPKISIEMENEWKKFHSTECHFFPRARQKRHKQISPHPHKAFSLFVQTFILLVPLLKILVLLFTVMTSSSTHLSYPGAFSDKRLFIIPSYVFLLHYSSSCCSSGFESHSSHQLFVDSPRHSSH